MKLDEFITGVLLDIESGLKKVNETTGKKFAVVSQTGKDVMFDVAVTASNAVNANASGGVKAGLVEVFGAKIDGKLDTSMNNTEVSRIQFCVNFPALTVAEDQALSAEIQRQSQENAD